MAQSYFEQSIAKLRVDCYSDLSVTRGGSRGGDPQCVICLEDILSSDETVVHSKCKRYFHSHCFGPILRVDGNKTCPTCRGRFVHFRAISDVRPTPHQIELGETRYTQYVQNVERFASISSLLELRDGLNLRRRYEDSVNLQNRSLYVWDAAMGKYAYWFRSLDHQAMVLLHDLDDIRRNNGQTSPTFEEEKACLAQYLLNDFETFMRSCRILVNDQFMHWKDDGYDFNIAVDHLDKCLRTWFEQIPIHLAFFLHFPPILSYEGYSN